MSKHLLYFQQVSRFQIEQERIEIAKVELEKVLGGGGWCSELLVLRTSRAQQL